MGTGLGCEWWMQGCDARQGMDLLSLYSLEEVEPVLRLLQRDDFLERELRDLVGQIHDIVEWDRLHVYIIKDKTEICLPFHKNVLLLRCEKNWRLFVALVHRERSINLLQRDLNFITVESAILVPVRPVARSCSPTYKPGRILEER